VLLLAITDFRSMVEQALGVEMQLMYTADLNKSSGGEQSRSQGDKKGHSDSPSHKKGKFQRRQAYRGSTPHSHASGGNTPTPQYRAWGWRALGVVIHIVSRSVNGLASALFVDKTTRTWFLGRILTLSFDGSQ